jgi:hypothetical protein
MDWPFTLDVDITIHMISPLIDKPINTIAGLLKKAASGVLASFPCSRTGSTLRAKKLTAALLDELF